MKIYIKSSKSTTSYCAFAGGIIIKIRRLALQQLGRKGKVTYFQTSPKNLHPLALVFVYLDTLSIWKH
jgi:hypothetical protein